MWRKQHEHNDDYRVFEHDGIHAILFWWFHIFGLFLLVGGIIGCCRIATAGEISSLYVSGTVLILGILSIFFANFYPKVIANEEGLKVRFFLWYLPVKWEEIIEVKPMLFFGRCVVKTRALTFFHRFYGLYAFSFMPSFIVRTDMTRLVEMIEDRKYTPGASTYLKE